MTTSQPTAFAHERPTGQRSAQAAPSAGDQPAGSWLFWILILYFVLEFLRPPVVSSLKIQMVFVIVMPVIWLFSRNRTWSANMNFQLAFLAKNGFSISHAYNYFSAYMASRALWANTVAALSITWILSRRKEFVRAIWIWVAIMAYQAVFSVTIGGGRGNGGFIGDENDLALAIDTAFPFALMGALQYRGGKRLVCAGLLVLYASAVVASFSRGGFVGFAVVAAYCLAYSKNRTRNFIAIAVGAALFFLAIPSEYKSELTSIQETSSGTAEARLFLWTAAYRMWLDNPILGVGAENSHWLVGEYQPEDVDSGMFSGRSYRERNWSGTPLHSLYFGLLSECGLVGVAIFGGMIWLHYRTISRTRKRVFGTPFASAELKRDAEIYGVSLAAAMAGYLSAGAFLSVLYYPYPYYFTALAAAYELMINRRLAEERERHAATVTGRSPKPSRVTGVTSRSKEPIDRNTMTDSAAGLASGLLQRDGRAGEDN